MWHACSVATIDRKVASDSDTKNLIKVIYITLTSKNSLFKINYVVQVGILVAGGYNEGRFTMFYPFNTNYVRGGLTTDSQNIQLGTTEGWIASGWLPDDRKVRNF